MAAISWVNFSQGGEVVDKTFKVGRWLAAIPDIGLRGNEILG